MSLAPRSFGYVALLVALGSFGPLTMSIYTPVMPSVGASLGAGAEGVKLTLTTYMLGSPSASSSTARSATASVAGLCFWAG